VQHTACPTYPHNHLHSPSPPPFSLCLPFPPPLASTLTHPRTTPYKRNHSCTTRIRVRLRCSDGRCLRLCFVELILSPTLLSSLWSCGCRGGICCGAVLASGSGRHGLCVAVDGTCNFYQPRVNAAAVGSYLPYCH